MSAAFRRSKCLPSCDRASIHRKAKTKRLCIQKPVRATIAGAMPSLVFKIAARPYADSLQTNRTPPRPPLFRRTNAPPIDPDTEGNTASFRAKRAETAAKISVQLFFSVDNFGDFRDNYLFFHPARSGPDGPEDPHKQKNTAAFRQFHNLHTHASTKKYTLIHTHFPAKNLHFGRFLFIIERKEGYLGKLSTFTHRLLLYLPYNNLNKYREYLSRRARKHSLLGRKA